MNKQPYAKLPWLFLFVGCLLLLAQAFLPAGNLRQALIFTANFVVPATLWANWLRQSSSRLESICGGAGLSFLTLVFLALLATYLPGPVSPALLYLSAAIALLLPFSMGRFHRHDGALANHERQWPRRDIVFLLLILFLASWLRLQNVTYKEFQGDEGVIMERAAQSLLGDELALLRHQKGPVEILLPLVAWGQGDAINELWARASFIAAGLLTVLTFATLSRRWFSMPVTLLATLLLAVGGFAIAFSRILQYQSFVMLWGLLSVLFAQRYHQSSRLHYLLLSAAFLAGGLLAHYDAILVAPAVAFLVLNRWRQSPHITIRHALAGIFTGGSLLAIFYGPYLLNPTIAGTGSYLVQDRLGGTLLSWSGPQVWRMATFYNSTYYIILLILLAITGLYAALSNRRHATASLMLLVPLLFYTVIVADPRTHIYTIFPGLSMIAAYGALALYRRIKLRQLQLAFTILIAFVLSVSTYYVYLLFVDTTPERQRTWADNRPPYFYTTWHEPPLYGLFGFPHQAGWRAALPLIDRSPYSSNEEPEITNWYMAQMPRTHCSDYETFILAANAQDALPYDRQQVEKMSLQATITVNGTPSMRIYGSDPPVVSPVLLEATGASTWRTPQQVAPPHRSGEVPVGETFGSHARLLGYTLAGQPSPGATVNVVLYWEALTPVERNYQVFVHLYDGTMWSQHDGAPDCNIQPTSGWEPGAIIRDTHPLQLPPDTPAGEIPLWVGMYDLITGDRLTVSGTGQDRIHLTDLAVRQLP